MKRIPFVCAAMAVAAISPVRADDWLIHMTVDNQFDTYFGTPTATNFYAGSGASWPTTYTFTALNRAPTDYLYVATSSDQSVAQGFIGDFTNTTTSLSINTGLLVWEVFSAGNHAQTNPYYPNPWPANQQPTQAQVDTAIAYATANNLWQAPDTDPNGAPNGVAPWGFRPGISANAEWIWHRAPNGPIDPLHGGYNHDEFLVFRVAGAVPAPASIGVLALGALGALRRRRG